MVEYIFMMVISNVYNVCLEGFADDKAFHAINYSESAKLRLDVACSRALGAPVLACLLA